MKKNSRKKIEISNDVWKRLHDLKEKLKYKKWSAVICWLLDHPSSQGENRHKSPQLNDESFPEEKTDIVEHLHDSDVISKGENVVDPEKFLEALLSPRTWNQISKLKKDRDIDSFSRVFDILLDGYNLAHMERSQENVQYKIKERQDMAEIYNHIAKMGTFEYAEDLNLMDIPKIFSEKAWLCCPLCWSLFPLWVQEGDKPEPGIVFEKIDGNLARRFRGVDDKYQPMELRMGSEIISEKSMAVSTLRRLDSKLYDHIFAKLRSAYFMFGGRQL